MKINLKNCCEYGVLFDEKVPAYEYAYGELKKFIEQASGIVLERYKGQKYFISLGVTEECKKRFGENLYDGINFDGYKIIFDNGNIYIYGKKLRSVVFGVYGFLDKHLGVRFLGNVDYVPSFTELNIEEKSGTYSPLFKFRDYLNNPTCVSKTQSMKMGFLTENATDDRFGNLEKFGIVEDMWFSGIPSPHNSLYYVPLAEYEKDHPEFYSRTKGVEAVELCYSNGVTDDGEFDESLAESVVTATVKSLIKFKKQEPQSSYFMFGKPDDSGAICHCERCEKARIKWGGESGLMIVFFNAVLKKLREYYKEVGEEMDVNVVTFAYQKTTNPPKVDKSLISKVTPDENLFIRYAPINADYTYPLIHEKQKPEVSGQVKGWTALTKNLMLWDYNDCYHEYFFYFPNWHYIKENLQLYYDSGMQFVLNQSAYNINYSWVSCARAYVDSKLYWDMSLDVYELRAEYVRLYYGVASKYVQALMEKMDAFYEKYVAEGKHIAILSEFADYVNPKNYPIEWIEECIKIVQDAMEEVKNAKYSKPQETEYLRRLYFVLMTPLRMIMRNEYYYFPKGNEYYKNLYLKAIDITGTIKLGEGIPLWVNLVENGSSPYRIILQQQPTEKERQTAEYLQKRFEEKTGVKLPIVKDDCAYPAYTEKGICVGGGYMFGEFYKSGFDFDTYAYLIDVKGRCLFINGEKLIEGVDYFIDNRVVEDKKAGVYKIITHTTAVGK